MISSEQARAARAILQWTQSEIAAQAGLSVTAINYCEREIGNTRPDTLNAIQEAYENHGIIFLPDGGLRHDKDTFKLFNHQGDDFIKILNADMMRVLLRNPEREILTCSVDEKAWNNYAPRANAEFLKFATQHKIRERILVTQKPSLLNNKDARYRRLPINMMGTVTYTLYGDRVAYLLWSQKRIIICRNGDLAETLRVQFDFLWDQGKIIG